MKKNLFALSLLLGGLTATAQTPRLSLFEEFTGETCPPCAATNPGLNILLASPTNTPKVVAIKWQVPIPSVPSPTWSLYKTNQAEIDWRYKGSPAGYGYPSQWTATTAITSGINAAPTGLFDGQHQWVFGAASDHPFYVSNAVIATAQSYTSAFSVTMTKAWDATYSSYNVTVNIVASANFTATGNLVFRTVMVERKIHFNTQPGTNGEKDFEDVAIRSFPTLQGGTAMVGAWTIGQSQTFVLNCPLPSYVRDKAEVGFVGFIQDDGNRKVAQAVRSLPAPVGNDIKAISLVLPAISCLSPLAPTVTVKNIGLTPITAFTISPTLDLVPQTIFQWAGNLAVGASTTVVLGAFTGITPGGHSFVYNISAISGTDDNTLNNMGDTKFVYEGTGTGSSVQEGFVGAAFPPTDWVTYNGTTDPTWIKSTTVGGYALTSNSTKLDLFATIPDGSVNELVLPPLSFTGAGVPSMSFDVAYSQYNGENDKLEVYASGNCGLTWTSLYNKQGSSLSTTGTNLTPAFVPTSTQWRTEVVALTGFTSGQVLVKFVATSDYGNNLYLDNINLKQCLQQNMVVTSTKNTICKGETATLTATGATSVTWSGNQTTSKIVVSPTVTTGYTVTSADAGACGNQTVFNLVVNACNGIDEAAIGAQYSVYPNPNKGDFTINSGFANDKTSLLIFNALGQMVYTQNLNAGETSIKTNLPKGIYTYQVKQNETSVTTGKLIME